MTNVNSLSESLWEALHDAEDLVLHEGFPSPRPQLTLSANPSKSKTPGGGKVSSEPLDHILARYGDRLALGASWPLTRGSRSPQAIILCSAPLSEEELNFVRTWFENPRVNLQLEETFFIQPLPPFAGDQPPFVPFFKDLLASMGPKVLLGLGDRPSQVLLQAPLSLDTLRSSDYNFAGTPLVTTLAPQGYFALSEADQGSRNGFKAQVWKDLQRLLGKIRYA